MTRLPAKEKIRLDKLIYDLRGEPTREKLGYLCTETLKVYHQYNDRDYLDLVGTLAFAYQHLYE